MISVSAPVPLTSAITGASVLALSLIMLVCSCLVCRARRKLCFEGNIGHHTLRSHWHRDNVSGSPAEKELAADNKFLSHKAESKVSLVNESQEKVVSPPGPVTPLRVSPHSTKV